MVYVSKRGDSTDVLIILRTARAANRMDCSRSRCECRIFKCSPEPGGPNSTATEHGQDMGEDSRNLGEDVQTECRHGSRNTNIRLLTEGL